MAGTLEQIASFVNSPPGVITAGGVLAGACWKFFQKVEDVLTDDTKFEIAVWLVGIEIGQRIESWPQTFVRVFDRVFGSRHLSFKCFVRSSIASVALFMVGWLFLVIRLGFHNSVGDLTTTALVMTWTTVIGLAFSLIPDYVVLLKTRLVLHLMTLTHRRVLWLVLLTIDATLTLVIASTTMFFGLGFAFLLGIGHPPGEAMAQLLSQYTVLLAVKDKLFGPFVYAAFFASAWVWLYAASAVLVQLARRFDIGFRWFNSKFDIERKPLRALGFVSGALVAVCWWTLVLLSNVQYLFVVPEGDPPRMVSSSATEPPGPPGHGVVATPAVTDSTASSRELERH